MPCQNPNNTLHIIAIHGGGIGLVDRYDSDPGVSFNPLVFTVCSPFLAGVAKALNPTNLKVVFFSAAIQNPLRISPNRPTSCRDLEPWGENGLPDGKCTRARAAHGLSPLEPIEPVLPGTPETEAPRHTSTG